MKESEAIMRFEIDPEISKLFRLLTEEEYQKLERSLREEGCREALIAWNGILVDGHHRYKICNEYGIPYEVIEKEFPDRSSAIAWVYRNQEGRRNLTIGQKLELASRKKAALALQGKERQAEAGKQRGRGGQQVGKLLHNSGKAIDATRDAAGQFGVSHDSLRKYEVVKKRGTEVQIQGVLSGEMSLDQAHKQVKAKQRKAEKMEKMRVAAQATVTPLNELGKFSVIYADPPWQYEHETQGRQEIENVYPTMLLSDIMKLPIDEIAMGNCILFLWCPNPKVGEAIDVVRAWGFNYRTNFVWVKDRIGMGYYNRQKHEMLMIAVKGTTPTPDPGNRPPSVIEAPRREHSRKPDEIYEMIEKMYPDLRKVELFARHTHPGWIAWGNEVDGDGLDK